MSNTMPSAGLEVVPQEHHAGLEPVKHVAVYPEQGPEFYDKGASSRADQEYNNNTHQFWGLKRKTLWVLVAAAFVVIIAGSLGGGLGGGLSQRTQSHQPQQTQEQTSSSSIITSTSVPASVSTGTTRKVSTVRNTLTHFRLNPIRNGRSRDC
jgi:hypothetical protein